MIQMEKQKLNLPGLDSAFYQLKSIWAGNDWK